MCYVCHQTYMIQTNATFNLFIGNNKINKMCIVLSLQCIHFWPWQKRRRERLGCARLTCPLEQVLYLYCKITKAFSFTGSQMDYCHLVEYAEHVHRQDEIFTQKVYISFYPDYIRFPDHTTSCRWNRVQAPRHHATGVQHQRAPRNVHGHGNAGGNAGKSWLWRDKLTLKYFFKNLYYFIYILQLNLDLQAVDV